MAAMDKMMEEDLAILGVDVETVIEGVLELNHNANPTGRPTQRLAHHVIGALCGAIPNSLLGFRACATFMAGEFSAIKELTPFVKFFDMIGSRVLFEFFKEEAAKMIHIVDLDITDGQGQVWVDLMGRLQIAGCLPWSLRITAGYKYQETLNSAAATLSQEAARLGILHFDFHGILLGNPPFLLNCGDVTLCEGETTVVYSINKLNHLVSFSDQVGKNYLPPIGYLEEIRTLLRPKMVVLGEKELNNNISSFRRRYQNVVRHFSAWFKCLAVTLAPLETLRRLRIEGKFLAKEMRECICFEKRYLNYDRWCSVMHRAGYMPASFPACAQGMFESELSQIPSFAKFSLARDSLLNCLYIRWDQTPLYSISSWKPETIQVDAEFYILQGSR